MGLVALGVSELRVQDDDGSYRIFYYTASAKGVLVFHAFVKETHRTGCNQQWGFSGYLEGFSLILRL